MNRLALALAGASALVAAAPASAAVFTPGVPNFQVFGNINNGPVTAQIGNTITTAGAFTDEFRFTLDQTGFGSGAITTGTTTLLSPTDLDITSVLVNGIAAVKTFSDGNRTEAFTLSGVPITFGQLNTITVTGISRGLGSYGGNATFIPAVTAAVPEPATWAMMLLGFGAVGYSMRRRKANVNLAHAV